MDVDFWWGKGEERDHLEYQGIDGRIIIKCLKEIRCNDTAQGHMVGFCEHGN